MEKEICISELEKLSHLYNIKIIIAEKMGKRWSYVTGAGEEQLLPARLIAKQGRYALFVEGNSFDKEMIVDSFRRTLKSFDLRESK